MMSPSRATVADLSSPLHLICQHQRATLVNIEQLSLRFLYKQGPQQHCLITAVWLQMLDVQLPFSEVELVNENAVYLARVLELQQVSAHSTAEAAGTAVEDRALAALPGDPTVEFSS